MQLISRWHARSLSHRNIKLSLGFSFTSAVNFFSIPPLYPLDSLKWTNPFIEGENLEIVTMSAVVTSPSLRCNLDIETVRILCSTIRRSFFETWLPSHHPWWKQKRKKEEEKQTGKPSFFHRKLFIAQIFNEGKFFLSILGRGEVFRAPQTLTIYLEYLESKERSSILETSIFRTFAKTCSSNRPRELTNVSTISTYFLVRERKIPGHRARAPFYGVVA